MSLFKDLNNGKRCLVINVVLFWIFLGQKIPDFEEKPKNFFFKRIENIINQIGLVCVTSHNVIKFQSQMTLCEKNQQLLSLLGWPKAFL